MTETTPTPPAAPEPKAAAPLSFLDFANANQGDVKSALGSLDLGALLKNPATMLLLMELVNKLLSLKKPAPTPTGTPSTRPPEPGDNIPAPPPEPAEPPVKVRVITSFVARYFHISRKNKDIPKPEFDAIIGRSGYCDDADRVHLNVTPYDQFGREIGPGSPELEQLVRRWTDENGVPHQALRLRWLIHAAGPGGLPIFTGGGDAVGEVTNEYDDYGMTPVLKVPQGLRLSEKRELGCFQLEFTPDGQARGIVSNILTSVMVKPWGE